MSLEEQLKQAVYFLANITANLRGIDETVAFHPRAWKLMQEKRNFLVVAADEPYFDKVYGLIRTNERIKGTWTDEDERKYRDAIGE
jgi:hypothetical protein